MTEHLPVYSWLRPATAFLKRYANQIMSRWDDEVQDANLKQMMVAIITRRCANKTLSNVHGCVKWHEFKDKVDEGSLAT